MHASLQPKANRLLLFAWCVAVTLVAATAARPPWLLLVAGALLGAAGGFLQLGAFRSAPASFVGSKTAIDVRRALASTQFGRTYLYWFWVSMVVLAALAFALPIGGGLVGWIAGYCSFAAARELLTLRGTVELQRLSENANEVEPS